MGVSATAPDSDRQLLRDVSYEFSPGSRVGIAGPNGAGKSSLLDIIAGIKQPQVGLKGGRKYEGQHAYIYIYINCTQAPTSSTCLLVSRL